MKVLIGLKNTGLGKYGKIHTILLEQNTLYFTASQPLTGDQLAEDNVIMITGKGEHCDYVHCKRISFDSIEGDKYKYKVIEVKNEKKK
jgi:hypothetical protein